MEREEARRVRAANLRFMAAYLPAGAPGESAANYLGGSVANYFARGFAYVATWIIAVVNYACLQGK